MRRLTILGLTAALYAQSGASHAFDLGSVKVESGYDMRSGFGDRAPVGREVEVPGDVMVDVAMYAPDHIGSRAGTCGLKAEALATVLGTDPEFGVLVRVTRDAPKGDTYDGAECPFGTDVFVSSGPVPVRDWGAPGTLRRERGERQAREADAVLRRRHRMADAAARIEATAPRP